MNITFLGAAREVTGSNMLIETENNVKILVDCGLIQGRKAEEEKNKDPFLYNPKEIDFVLLTHAHIDHSGRIPKLYNEGFRGKVYCTKATKELCSIMLPDSGHIQETETEWVNRKRGRQNKKLIEPLYTKEDAEKSISLFETVDYDEIFEFGEGLRLRFNDAGHMLGSAIIELWVTENGVTKKTVFSGDLGSGKNALLDDPAKIKRTDYLVLESTYGNRLHPDLEGRGKRFLEIVSKTLKRGGTVVIPSFAVGRTQEIVFELDKLKERYKEDKEFQEEYREVMESKVYIDSPLATFATEVFSNNLELFDEEIQKTIAEGNHPLDFPGLKFTKSVDESKALNELKTPKIIISASGMCDAGRIKHHLKHNIWDPNNTILFVGYQAPGTLGRRIVDGAKQVKIFGEDVAVNAQIEFIEGYSGHADQNGLIDFISGFKKDPKAIFLVHGDYDSQLVLKNKIKEDFSSEIYIPRFGSSYELTEIVRKSRKVKYLALKDIRDEKLQFVDTMDNLGNSLNITLSKLRDYIVADKTFNEDPNIWNKEEEHLEKLYKLSNAFNEEVKYLLNNRIERKTKDAIKEEPYEVPDFGRKKNLLNEVPYSFDNTTLNSKGEEGVRIKHKEKNLKLQTTPKSIKIMGAKDDPIRKKLEEIKNRARKIEENRIKNKETEQEQKLEQEQEVKKVKEETKEISKAQNTITISPQIKEEKEKTNKEKDINSKEEDKINEEEFLSQEEKAELAILDKQLEEEIKREEEYASKDLKSIEDLMKEVEEANKRLEKEKKELKQLKETKLDQEIRFNEVKEKENIEKREKAEQEAKAEIKEEIKLEKESNDKKEETVNLDKSYDSSEENQASEDVNTLNNKAIKKEKDEEKNKDKEKVESSEEKEEKISEASKIINELSEEINKLDETSADDELVIANIFGKIAMIENLDDLSDEDVERIKKEIEKMEEKINNG